MRVTTDSKKRIIIPAKPGDQFDVQTFGKDKFILTRLEPVQRRPATVKLAKKNGFTVGETNQEINPVALEEMLQS